MTAPILTDEQFKAISDRDEQIDRLKSALHALATGLRWEEELRAWVLSDLGALTRARQALAPRCERCGDAGYVTMFDDNSRAPCPSCAGAGVVTR